MANATIDQAKELAKYYAQLALIVSMYRFNNWDKLSETKRTELSNQHRSLETYSQDYIDMAASIVFKDVEKDLATIQDITADIGKSIDKLKKVQQVINVIGAALELGGAIVSKNPGSIAGKIKNFLSVWKSESESGA